MNARQIALGVNSALYTLCCFVAGLAIGNPVAWRLAILAFAFQTLAWLWPNDKPWDMPLVIAGFACGVGAGVALLFG